MVPDNRGSHSTLHYADGHLVRIRFIKKPPSCSSVMTPPLRVSKQIQLPLGHLDLRWKQPLIFIESSDDGRKRGWELMCSTPLLQCRISFLEASMLQNRFNLLKFYSDEDSTASVAGLFQCLSISAIRVLLTVKDFRKLGQLKPVMPGS